MGEVYRATDTRLDRTVAIKVLPEHLADDPQRRERFEREARAVSSLNHPHICTLHDIGEQDGMHYLVMELVEGETLQGLEKGRPPLDQALEYAIQIADALDKAHRQGVVHRDLKPGNIMITKSAGVKLLDFGLAKLKGDAGQVSPLSQMPTQDPSAPLTAEGTIIGTLQYMAPEQLEGKEADARTDIFAFGAVVYEMVTGKKAFEGTSQASLISSIMTVDPKPMSDLQVMAPSALDHVVRRCLAKDPDGRWQAASDVRLETRWIADRDTGTQEPEQSDIGRLHQRLPWIVGVAGAVLAALLTSVLMDSPLAPTAGVTRLTLTLPSDQRLAGNEPLALSPDGSRLVYTASTGDQPMLYLRPLDQYEASVIPGTEGAANPFFSPDGQSVGFFAEGQLKTVRLSGGLPTRLAAAPYAFGATWGEDGQIIFSPALNSGLWRVSEGGGEAERLTQPDFADAGYAHVEPQHLPDGRSVLFMVWGPFDAAVLSLDTMRWEEILSTNEASYVPTGHLIFNGRNRQVEAIPFDLASLSPTGNSVGVLTDVINNPGAGFVYSTSSNGTLAYVPLEPPEPLVWVNRQGQVEPLEIPARRYARPRLSLGAERIAVAARGLGLEVVDIASGTSTTIPTVAANFAPLWLDGRTLAFSSNRAGTFNIYSVDVDSGGETEAVLVKEYSQHPESWLPEERLLVYRELHPISGSDIWVLSLDDGETRPFVVTPGYDRFARFLPTATG